MSYHWNPTKKEIKDCLDRKIHEFAVQKNGNPRLSKEKWLDFYV